jgi:Novel STAND NTPase 1
MIWELLAGRPPFKGDKSASCSVGSRRPRYRRCASTGLTCPPPSATFSSGRRRSTPPIGSRRLRTSCSPGPTPFAERWATVTLEHADADALGAAMATLTKLGLGKVNPYNGLRPFDETDAASFFGREDDTEKLTSLVLADGFSAVVGLSGSGKSSLVRAGLVPRLRAKGSLVVVVVAGADLGAEVLDALNEVTIDDHGRRTVGEALAAAVPTHGELVVVLDQFEELWTLANADQRAEVLAALTRSTGVRVSSPSAPTSTTGPLADPLIGPQVREATFALTPLTPIEANGPSPRPRRRWVGASNPASWRTS